MEERDPKRSFPQVLANQFLDLYQKVPPLFSLAPSLNFTCRSTRANLFQQQTTSGGCCTSSCPAVSCCASLPALHTLMGSFVFQRARAADAVKSTMRQAKEQ